MALTATLALAALVPGPAAALGRDIGRLGPLPWRPHGDLPFTVDAAVFPDSSGFRTEVYVRIPPTTLGTATPDTFGVTAMALHVRLRAGGAIQDRDQVVTGSAADSATGFGKVVSYHFLSRPGPLRLRVRLEDSNSRKRGLLYVGRQIARASEIEGDLPIPRAQMGRDLSNLAFLWPAPPAADDSARARDAAGLPNPERMYGLYTSDLLSMFRARSPDLRPWHWVARVLGANGTPLMERDSTSDASRRLEAIARLDVSTLPAGGYDLEVKAWQEGDAGALARRARFSIAWKPESWTTDPTEIEDAVHLLLGGDDEESFTRLEPGERERYLDDYWKARDPTPGTAENEALREFLTRVEYANRTYSRTGLQKGMFTDMGRVYIRYGVPDEVLHQVIPAGDETLDEVLDEIARTESRPATDVRQPGPGGDIRPFEVWVYEGVVPTPFEADPRQKGAVRRRKLTFLFVDEQGFGQYTQRYSTE